jgi:hypothetical protein
MASDLLSKILVERAISLHALVSDNPARIFNLKEFSIFLTIVAVHEWVSSESAKTAPAFGSCS